MSGTAYHKSQAVSICRADGRIIGAVRGDTFEKRVAASKHFVRKPPAIAFDIQTLMDARAAGAVFIHVTDVESGRDYYSTVHTVLHDGFSLNRGFGNQVALPIGRWNTGGDDLGAQLVFPF